MRFKSIFVVVLLAVSLAAAGCSSSGGTLGSSGGACGGLGSQGMATGIVDMAIGDDINNQVDLFFDVLATGDTVGNPDSVVPDPDIRLDNATSGINSPRGVFLTAVDLYVGNASSNTVGIFRSYLTLSDNAAPDVVLDNGTAGISGPRKLLVDADDNLIVSNTSANTLTIYRDASAITVNQAPDVSLNNANSLLNQVQDFFVSGGDLYVANVSNSGVQPGVSIFRDISTLATNDVPDVQLSVTTSFFDDTRIFGVLISHDDTLYVSNDQHSIFVFRDASSLSTNALPDAIIFGAATHIDFSSSMVDLPTLDGLVVTNNNLNDNDCTDAPGVVGFADAANLATGNPATVVLSQDTSNIGSAFAARRAGGALFIAGYAGNCDLGGANVYIFRNVDALGLCDSSKPNIVFPATDVIGNDYGPFGTVRFFNGISVNQRIQVL